MLKTVPLLDENCVFLDWLDKVLTMLRWFISRHTQMAKLLLSDNYSLLASYGLLLSSAIFGSDSPQNNNSWWWLRSSHVRDQMLNLCPLPQPCLALHQTISIRARRAMVRHHHQTIRMTSQYFKKSEDYVTKCMWTKKQIEISGL